MAPTESAAAYTLKKTTGATLTVDASIVAVAVLYSFHVSISSNYCRNPSLKSNAATTDMRTTERVAARQQQQKREPHQQFRGNCKEQQHS